jgi:hypothetical protein
MTQIHITGNNNSYNSYNSTNMHHIVYNTTNTGIGHKKESSSAVTVVIWVVGLGVTTSRACHGARSTVIDRTTVYANPISIQEQQNVK